MPEVFSYQAKNIDVDSRHELFRLKKPNRRHVYIPLKIIRPAKKTKNSFLGGSATEGGSVTARFFRKIFKKLFVKYSNMP
jgi:hypothetical protein